MSDQQPTPRPLTSEISTESRPRPFDARAVAAILLVVSVFFAFWCFGTLRDAHSLRKEVDVCLDWLQELRWMRGEVSTWNARTISLEGSDWSRLEDFLDASNRLARRDGNPEMLVARQSLEQSYDRLRSALSASADGESEGGAWAPAMDVLRAGEIFARHVERRLETLHRLRDGVRRSINLIGVVAVVSMFACTGLFWLADRRRRTIREILEEAERQTTHDRLTGLWNREGMLRLIGQELIRAERDAAPLGLILVDIERFSEINQMLGQDQGDDILRAVSERLGTLVRPYDTMGRFGGDSFLIALPGCDERSTQNVAQRLLQSVHDHKFEHSYGRIEVEVKAAMLTVRRPAEANVDALVIELQKQLAG